MREATIWANRVLNTSKFYTKLLQKKDYKGIEGGDIQKIAKLVRYTHNNFEFEIRLERHYNPGSLMIAYYTPKKPDIITVNRWNLYSTWANRFRMGRVRRDLEDNVGTNVHEFIHLVDFRSMHMDFGHAGNSSVGKGDYVPYYAGKIAKEICIELMNERNR